MAASGPDAPRRKLATKRPLDIGGAIMEVKKAKSKKSGGAIKTLLNFFHIKDRKRPAPVNSDPYQADGIKKRLLSPLPSEDSKSSFPPPSHKTRAGLSNSWSYFVHDPFDELDEEHNRNDCAAGEDDQVFFNDSYFEDDYCTDYHEHTEEDLASIKSPNLRGIRMGVSSLKLFGRNERIPEVSRTPCGEFRRDSVARSASRKLHVSLPDVTSMDLPAETPKKSFEVNDSYLVSSPISKSEDQCVPRDPTFGLNIVFDYPLPGDTIAGVDVADIEEKIDNLSFLADDERQAKTGTLISPERKENGSYSRSPKVDKVEDEEHIFNTHVSKDGARYRDKCPSPLNLTSTPDGKRRGAHSLSPDFAVFSDSPTTDNNHLSEPNDTGPSDEEMVTADSSRYSEKGHCKMDISSVPSSGDERTDAKGNATAQSEPAYLTQSNIDCPRRRSVESGYESYGKAPSTAGTPPEGSATEISPEGFRAKSLFMDRARSQWEKTLSALGDVKSPRVLNKLDGILSPPRSIRRCLSPRFRFPSVISPELRVVPEASETSLNESLGTAEASSSANYEKRSDSKRSVPDLAEQQRSGKGEGYQNMTDSNHPRTPSAAREETRSPPLNISHNAGTDENGNYAILSPAAQCPPSVPEVTLTPANKIPTPISTSSPLQHLGRVPTSAARPISQLASDLVSPVRRDYVTPKSRQVLAQPGTGSSRKKRRKRHNRSRENSRSTLSSTSCDLNNNFRASLSSDEDVEVISPSSMDYLHLKRSADFIVNRIPNKKVIKPYLNLARLIDYLNNFYLGEIQKLANKKVKTISDFKNIKTEFCDIFREDRLTAETCIAELLVSALVNRPRILAACADFAFENLHYVAKTPAFLHAAPEVIVLLLSNDHQVVLGSHGFPLTYQKSEVEIYRTARLYMRTNRTGKPEQDAALESLLLSATDPALRAKTENCHRKTSLERCPHHNKSSTEHRIPLVCKRPYHDIEYQRSKTFVATPDTRQEYLFQPFLSSAAASSCGFDDVRHCTREVTSPGDEVMELCNSAHTLRKLYFSYRRHNQVPYITQIGLQYACRGQKKLYTFGQPNKPGVSSPNALEKTLNNSACSKEEPEVNVTPCNDSLSLLDTRHASPNRVKASAAMSAKSPEITIEATETLSSASLSVSVGDIFSVSRATAATSPAVSPPRPPAIRPPAATPELASTTAPRSAPPGITPLPASPATSSVAAVAAVETKTVTTVTVSKGTTATAAALPPLTPLPSLPAPSPTTSTNSNSPGTPRSQAKTKMTAMKLATGEHVTGVALLGDAVLHNIEITTNKGRRIRAHPLPDHLGSPVWTSIPAPVGDSPHCLQALYAEVRTPSTHSYLRDIGAVWAVLSRPMNNLSS